MSHVWKIILLLFPVLASAQWNTRISGWEAAIAADGDEAFDTSKQVLGLRSHLEIGARTDSVRLHSILEYPSVSDLGEKRHTVVREAWLRMRTSAVDFTLGRQLFPEGRGDWIYPQNQFAPRDYTQLTPFPEEQRLGLPAARLDYYPSMETALAVAAVRQDTGHVLYGHPDLPNETSLEDEPASGVLLRFDYRAGPLEYGLSIIKGQAPTPLLAVDAAGLAAKHRDQNTYAVDGSYSIGGDLLRWDFAYVTWEDGTYPGLPDRYWIAVLGLDKRVWADGVLSVQLVHKSADLPSLSSDPALATAEISNRQLSDLYRSGQSWLTLNLRQSFRETHELEIGHLQGEGRERIDFVRWSWAFADRWKFSLQALSAEGGEDTLAGSLLPTEMVFGELRFYY